MAEKPLSSYSSSETFLRLPHPFLTNYTVQPTEQFKTPVLASEKEHDANIDQNATTQEFYVLSPNNAKPYQDGGKFPESPLHRSDFSFSEPQDLKQAARPPQSNNTAWGRARRSPLVTFVWGYEGCPSSISQPKQKNEWRDEPPTLGQLWLQIYALFTYRPSVETFRLRLFGPKHEKARYILLHTLLAVPHPAPAAAPGSAVPVPNTSESGWEIEMLLPRASFWQGAGAPFGAKPAWIPVPSAQRSWPLPPHLPTLTYEPTDAHTHARPVLHPVRPAKPVPGSVIYSRYIPHLGETFSMTALNLDDPVHLNLFHEWQNDPRVSAGWNESGTLDHHRAYLTKLRDDPSQIPLLAYWDNKPFAYFEVYWGAEDRLGAYYPGAEIKAYDRGRHSLVGDPSFRGPHRVSAWWGSLVHYLFLDEPRTMRVIGEPKATNGTVLMYDFMAGFGMMGFAELPHKRSAMVSMSRERFFSICPLGGVDVEKVVGGTGVGVLPKL